MKVLIVGAGIAGLSMARLLDKQNIDYTIIEKKTSLSALGAGIALPFNAMRALKEIGVYDAVMEQAHQVKEIRYTKSDGKILAQSDLTKAPFTHDQFVALKRNTLLEILSKGLKGHIHYATELTSFNNKELCISVESENSTVAGDYDLVIAADGINSSLRDQEYIGETTLYNHNLTGWRFIVKAPNHQLEPTYMLGNTDLFMVYPLSDNELYCYAHIHKDNRCHSITNDSKADLKKIFSNYAEPAKTILNTIDKLDIITGELRSVTETRFYRNRIAFIGDAANACSPLLQQGAAAAFEDAISLTDVIKNEKINLEEYQDARQKRVEWIVKYSDKPLASVIKMDNSVFRLLRNTIIRIVGPLNVHGWIKLATDPNLVKDK